jgi:hypothetical protein
MKQSLVSLGSALLMLAGTALVLTAYLTPEWAVNDAADVKLGPVRACSPGLNGEECTS